jgi:hypothetical protein
VGEAQALKPVGPPGIHERDQGAGPC